jgi:hypothetical protein
MAEERDSGFVGCGVDARHDNGDAGERAQIEGVGGSAKELDSWEKNCLFEHGVILMGNKRHYCYDWDLMPIDETCAQFECCSCYK